MKFTSRTGLLASPTKQRTRILKANPVQLKAVASPAPFIVKPLAGLYNPFSQRCSLLCNHPANVDAKKMIQKARERAHDGKSFLFPEDVATIRAEMEQLHLHEAKQRSQPINSMTVESVPEELFRRYTETDSRPLTPAPTLASAHTRASATRRCVTPDPIFTSEVREKTLLVLDLRRSHSQETLSWYGSTYPPNISVVLVENNDNSPSPVSTTDDKKSPKKCPKTVQSNLLQVPTSKVNDSDNDDGEGGDTEKEEEEVMKRRGKRRKKKTRDASRGPPMFHASLDPETLVATIEPDSQNVSTRPSLVPNACEAIATFANRKLESARRLSLVDIDSFLEYDMLRHLRRELTAEIVENEFCFERRKALEEALRTVPKVRVDCTELIELKKSIKMPNIDTDTWLVLPRMFKRSAVRFELPMDSRILNSLTPINYISDYVILTSTRKMLYNFIFNLFKIENDDTENVQERQMYGEKLPVALGGMMGKQFKDEQINFIRELIGWKDEDLYNFKTFCGLSALCERLLAKEFYPQLPEKSVDRCNEIEVVDFQSLERRLQGKTVDPRLERILHLIKTA